MSNSSQPQDIEGECSHSTAGEHSEQTQIEHNIHCCIICREPGSPQESLATVKKGLDKVLEYGRIVNDEVTSRMVLESQSTGRSIYIHRLCQKNIYNVMKRKSSGPLPPKIKIPRVATTRSEMPRFDWKTDCFICGKQCHKSDRPDRIDWHQVQVLEMRNTKLDICLTRNDDLASDVQRRLFAANDLVAFEARYHMKCRENFKKFSPQLTPGRPLNQEKETHFDRLCEWLESEVEVYSLAEIHTKKTELSQNSEDVYSKKWLKTKLKKRYGDHVRFVESEGKSSMVCLENIAELLITDKWYQDRKSTAYDEARRIISMAEKLIREDIRSKIYSCDSYPCKEEIESVDSATGWLPPLLLLLLE